MFQHTLKEIGDFLKNKVSLEKVVSHYAFDSRQVEKETLFFALRGKKKDGHFFLQEVAQKGAIAAVVSKNYKGPSYGLVLFFVKDVIKALQDLARFVHQNNPTYVIAITGSVGKTTTKEFCSELLTQKYRVEKTFGNANSQVSLPLFILNRREKAEILLVEMGMSFPGELERLVAIMPPNFGVLTKIGLSHAENFESLEAIAEAKAQLFHLETTKNALINYEAKNFKSIRAIKGNKYFFSMTHNKVDYFLKKEKNQIFLFEKGKQSPSFSLSFLQTHLLENVLCAIAVARLHDLSWEEIKQGLKRLKPYKHRFEIIYRNNICLIDDSYNSSPQSLKAALSNLPKGKRKIALIASMKELGRFTKKSHEQIAEYALDKVDHLLCIGEETKSMVQIFQKEGKPAQLLYSRQEATRRLKRLVREGDVVLIKGSNSFELWKILDEI